LLAFTALNFAALQLVAPFFLPNGLFVILAADLPFDDETEPYLGSRRRNCGPGYPVADA
jgi:hypothetical protein